MVNLLPHALSEAHINQFGFYYVDPANIGLCETSIPGVYKQVQGIIGMWAVRVIR